METRSPKRLEIGLPDWPRVEAALRAATRKALLQHVQAGEPVVAWRDGAVVLVPPAEALAQHDSANQKKAS